MGIDPELLKKLFVDPDMFASRDSFRDAGFDVVKRESDNKIMVGSHASAPGFLFKKYCDDISLDEQLKNYERRLEGVRELRALIKEHHLRRIVVPQKWLHEFPREFSRKKDKSYVLIVERLNVYDREESEREYQRIDEETLKELCVVLFKFRGLDSNASNVPFTHGGQIAFIDTEHWYRRRSRKRRKSKPYLKWIHEHLSSKRWKFAKEIFEALDEKYGDEYGDDDDE
jgi:hypothetical protein